MPFKRKDSPYWQIRKYNLPGYGDTGALSTRSTSREVALRMELLLKDIADKAMIDSSWTPILDAVCGHDVALPYLLRQYSQDGLSKLRKNLNDPLISEAIKTYTEAQEVRAAIRWGFTLLERFAGGERMSWLCPQTILPLLYRYENEYGVKKNTVRSKLYQAISSLLRFHYSTAESQAIMSEVSYKGEDDTREVYISPEDISRLLRACYDIGRPELVILIQLALVTSADRGVLLYGKDHGKEHRGLLKKDIKIMHVHETGLYRGEVFLKDSKTSRRTRTVPLPHSVCVGLLELGGSKSDNETVFSIKYQSFKDIWGKARRKAGFYNEETGKYKFTFKDLRAQTAIYAEQAGISQTTIMQTLGHSNEATTRRYQRRNAAMSQQEAESVYAGMFGTVDKRKVSNGG